VIQKSKSLKTARQLFFNCELYHAPSPPRGSAWLPSTAPLDAIARRIKRVCPGCVPVATPGDWPPPPGIEPRTSRTKTAQLIFGEQVAVLVLKARENWASRLVTFSRFPSKSGAFLATRLPGGGMRKSVLKKGSQDRSSRDLDNAARSMRNSRGGRIVPPAMPPPPPPPLPGGGGRGAAAAAAAVMPVFTAREVAGRSAGGICEQPNVLPSAGKIGGQLRSMAAGGKEVVKKWTTREDPDAKRAAALEAQRAELAEAEAVARLKLRAEQAEADGRAAWQVSSSSLLLSSLELSDTNVHEP